MRRYVPRRRAWLAVAALPIIGLALGLIAPGAPSAIEIGGLDQSQPRFLASQYTLNQSTLWSVAADDLDGDRELIADIPHAPGWDIHGATSPNGDAAALLVVPPHGWDPSLHASLTLATHDSVRRLAGGLDLGGGLVWSDDGRHIAVRRNHIDETGGASIPQLLVLNADDGVVAARYQSPDGADLFPVALRGDRLWAASITSNGTTLLTLSIDRGAAAARATVAEQRRIASGWTREWTLSPAADMIAFTRLDGLDLSVHVVWLHQGRSDDSLVFSSPGAAPAIRAALSPTAASAAGGAPDSAAPAWRPDGGLSVGAWNADREPGFTLPISWDPSGRWLAVRSFSGDGPRQPGQERAAVIAPDGARAVSADEDLRLLGWWSPR